MNDIATYFREDGLFEQSGQRDGEGRQMWSARSFMEWLGYDNYPGFSKAINRAIGTCATLNLSIEENFRHSQGPGGEKDTLLSRFACYLVSMNGDVRKPGVAAAQVYFASLAEATWQYARALEDVGRVETRDQLTTQERSLTGVASRAGVTRYDYFQAAGYLGMYNMPIWKLKELKGLPDPQRSLLDFMDRRELAGNLFRVTETEERLKGGGQIGQRASEQIAQTVGRRVRQMMLENGVAPEHIPLVGDIRESRKRLKTAARQLSKLDAPRKRKPPALPSGE